VHFLARAEECPAAAGKHACYKFVAYMEGALDSGASLARRIAERDGIARPQHSLDLPRHGNILCSLHGWPILLCFPTVQSTTLAALNRCSCFCQRGIKNSYCISSLFQRILIAEA